MQIRFAFVSGARADVRHLIRHFQVVVRPPDHTIRVELIDEDDG
jgi:hypothetical protein